MEFRSHIDGSKHLFTAESVMQAQRSIGADIIMAFDECTPYPATPAETDKSLALTQRWTERALEWLAVHPPLHGYEQRFFGIVQGGMHKEARARAIEHMLPLDLPGIALGGLSVGEPAEVMYDVAGFCAGAPAPLQAPLRHGSGHAFQSGDPGGLGDRHVRLRAAHAQRAQRHGFHLGRPASLQGGAPCD